MANMKKGLTFDDVILVPKYSEVLPSMVDLKTKLTANISLNIPLLSAAMDTVTESRLAISLARHGGIGIVHKNMTVQEQASEVDKVKRSESGMILDPITIESNKTIHEALEIMAKFRISGVPVVDKGKLKGILTNRDIRFEDNLDLLVSDRMTSENLVTVEKGTTLDKAKSVLQKHRIEKLLVVDKDGKLTGLITVKDILKKEDFPHAAVDRHGRLMVGAAVGVTGDYLERVAELKKAKVDIIAVDTAHGHTKSVISAVAEIKKKFNIDLIAGNIATADAAKALIDAGADAIKVGIGPGSICTTRIIAGVGVPQLTAVQDVYSIAQKNNIPVISDGGMRYSGDIAKSLAAGASCVMLGSLFAGTDESPGEVILWEGRSFKSYRGMGSLAAMKKGSSDRYFQTDSDKLVPEGIEGMVAYKGPIKETISQLLGGIRSSMGYCGVEDIKNFHKKSEFIQITSAGVKESHPHDVNITKESPNYRKPL
mgnify:CR=1 FL=1|tara:strand:- start:383 stop:1831 length:1449 start_codon:yes stop_codon:yes gene_type:complete